MESRPQNPEFRIILKTFTQGSLQICIFSPSIEVDEGPDQSLDIWPHCVAVY